MTKNLLSELRFAHSRDTDNTSYNEAKHPTVRGSHVRTLRQHGVQEDADDHGMERSIQSCAYPCSVKLAGGCGLRVVQLYGEGRGLLFQQGELGGQGPRG